MDTHPEKKENIGYEPFNTFVLRTPFFSFNEYRETMRRLERSEDYWKEFLQNKILQEAVFLASPALFEEIKKFLSGNLPAGKKEQKMKMAVLRYYTRMSTRCTPFGLFAGFSVGRLGEKDEVILAPRESHRRSTRLDMHYLCNLIQEVGKMEKLRHRLRYYPNTSSYPIGEKLRFIEYSYRNSERIHSSISVDYSSYLKTILDAAEPGATISSLVSSIVQDDITEEEARAFILELIDSQILVSELDPSVTGENLLNRFIRIWKATGEEQQLLAQLEKLNSELISLDKNSTEDKFSVYAEIEKLIKEIGIAYDPKFIFQTDMYKETEKATLDESVISGIGEALDFMNRISINIPNPILTKFMENFDERYESQELPLLQVLDTELGIGYEERYDDINPLLEGIVLPAPNPDYVEMKWNGIHSLLHKKFMEAYKNGDFCIELKDEDVKPGKSDWSKNTLTFSNICQIFQVKEGKPLLYVHGSGGSSAANLHGRFCHVTEKLENYVWEITDFEEKNHQEAIIAEIVHLPESRIGNILSRPVLRKYEIPYLCRPAVEPEYQIPLSDLYVSVRNGKVFLRSKRLNKEVIPRLSTAHNFQRRSMPVYHFLCDMQTQGLKGGFGFFWDKMSEENAFLPRVMYKNMIISLAKWRIETAVFLKLLEADPNGKPEWEGEKKDTIMSNLAKWREENQIPKYVMLPDGDNTLFVDMENSLSVQVLFSVIKKRPAFKLEEFPFDPDSAIVKDVDQGSYTNEFVFGFHQPTNKSY